MTLSPEHRENISRGLKERWERKRKREEAMEKVLKAARKVIAPADLDTHGQHLRSLHAALEEYDALDGD